MKAVLMSIQPRCCKLIARGKMTVEVRKTRPKIDTPFKGYIYCSTSETMARMRDGTFWFGERNSIFKPMESIEWNGKVIGEYVCYYVGTYNTSWLDGEDKLLPSVS